MSLRYDQVCWDRLTVYFCLVSEPAQAECWQFGGQSRAIQHPPEATSARAGTRGSAVPVPQGSPASVTWEPGASGDRCDRPRRRAKRGCWGQ